jgi:tRNA(Ile)-lysidine synthase
MALLHFLRHHLDLNLLAISVDHGLRGEDSKQDLLFVKDTCATWGIDFVGETVDVSSYKETTGFGTQEAARELRYMALERVMKDRNIDVVALGHHGDDQAETMFMQMVRGADPSAMKGMPVQRPLAHGRLIRPFLCVDKDALTAYNRKHHIPVRHDPSNEETVYTRNAFRHKVLPFLKEQNPKLSEHMQRMSERFRSDFSYIEQEAEKVLAHAEFSSSVDKFVQFSIRTFKSFPLALQRRAFHLILNYLYVQKTENLSYLHEEMFFDLIQQQKSNAELHFPQGLRIERAYDEVTLSFTKPNRQHPFNKKITIGETIELPDGGRLYAQWTEDQEEGDRYTFVCDSHHVKLPLYVRTRVAGDRISLRGMKGSKKVKDIFIDQKIPARLRNTWPVVTDEDGKLLWVIGLKKSDAVPDNLKGNLIRIYYENKADV